MISDLEKIVINKDEIEKRVIELGQQIKSDYSQNDSINEIVLVCILRGAVFFLSDLARAIDMPVIFDFISVSSYGDSSKSSGIVRIMKDLDENIEGKHVIIVEDIIDTGLTLNHLVEVLNARNPASLKICTLLSKPKRRKIDIKVDYIGFEIDDFFAVGYGLDYAGKYRNLPLVGALDPKIYSKD
ncbi:hypoxanthine phosphoribosyltransferase [Selenomonadales bacterium OttesenSCG-928-I06]|nr:hypoxanthine phosphoribosyltransferase [Selenomonadales bacterium OttesenSCG-928-I06]